ncbi:hypothetical protein A3Q56_03538 [Intoshia linei]|uniref:Uncharacterized protein n=1 Tax=Intoshia linei TaxID=1819745 RepID=A0A177B363_9BILA|nr:hypothetical protein A3Q56_03538 [Intoshia linei]
MDRKIVKQIISSDSVRIRGQPVRGPPAEETLNFSHLTLPRTARRTDNQIILDEPYAWTTREFLRKLLVGKYIRYKVDFVASDRKYCTIYTDSNENVAHILVRNGLARIRRPKRKITMDALKDIIGLEETAQTAGLGVWSKSPTNNCIRNIQWKIEDLNAFTAKYQNTKLKAIIEFTRGGSTFRAYFPELAIYSMTLISGIKCPSMPSKDVTNLQPMQPFADQAEFFTTARLLQRDVQLCIDSNLDNALLVTVHHPTYDIACELLEEGFAYINNATIVYLKPELRNKYRECEKNARDNNKKIWKDRNASNITTSKQNIVYENATVISAIRGNSLELEFDDGSVKRVFFSNIKSPISDNTFSANTSMSNAYSLFDSPYEFEAREYLRTNYVGKVVQMYTSYTLPQNGQLKEKLYAIIKFKNVDIREQLIKLGLSTVRKFRHDSEQMHLDQLYDAQQYATNRKLGMHSDKNPKNLQIVDLTNQKKLLQNYSVMIRNAPFVAVVERILTGSRFKLYLPNESKIINFLLAGVECPKPPIVTADNKIADTGEMYGKEVLQYSKKYFLQRTVEIKIDAANNSNFIGWLILPDKSNASISLLSEGLAFVHQRADRTTYYSKLLEAQEKAKKEMKNLWSEQTTENNTYIHLEDGVNNVISKISPVVNNREMEIRSHEPNCSDYKNFANNKNEYTTINNSISHQEHVITAAPNNIGKLKPNDNLSMNANYINCHLDNTPTIREKSDHFYTSYDPRNDSDRYNSNTTISIRENGMPEYYVIVTRVLDDFSFFAQNADTSFERDNLMADMKTEFDNNTSHIPFNPVIGRLCASRFSDGEWYRAMVEKISKNQISIFYYDYGNRENASVARLAELPQRFHILPRQCNHYRLAYVGCVPIKSMQKECVNLFSANVLHQRLKLTQVYTINNDNYAILTQPDNSQTDFALNMVKNGLAILSVSEIEPPPSDIYNKYLIAQQSAKSGRMNMWQYGDIRFVEEDDNQFGYQKK